MKPDVKKIIADIKATKGNRKFCNGLAGTLQDDNYASSICKYVKTVTPERIDLLIEYTENLEAEVTDMAVQLANAESKCRELAAENAYLLNGASRELNTSWMFHKTMLGAQAALVCLTHGYQAAAREWLEGTTDEAGAEIPDDISVGELHEWFESNMVSNGGNSGFLTRKEAEVAIRKECPATDAFLAEVRAQGVTEYASKRGFSFQHGSIHAHFGNGDVMVGSVTFENGDAGINFAPVREKTGGVGTHYDWTKGKTAEQVDSIFVIASSNAEGLEVIRDKLSEAIAQLRKGAAL